ncbi:MAG: site-specific integrase [Bacillota bacterium]
MYIREIETKKGKSKFEAFVDITPKGSIKRKRISKTFSTYKEAEKWAIIKEHESNKEETPFSISHQTVTEYFDDWMENYVKVQLSPTTYNGYKTIVDRHIKPDLGHIKLNELNSIQIQDYELRKLQTGRINGEGGLSPTTVLQHHRVLSKALNSALKKRIIERNPCVGVEAPRAINAEIMSMTKDQVKKFLELAKQKGIWYYTYMYLAVHTGMRRGEMLGLKWRDIYFDAGFIIARRTYGRGIDYKAEFKDSLKTQKSRKITLDKEDLNVLKKLKQHQEQLKGTEDKEYEDNDLLFAREDGKAFSPDIATSRFKQIAEELGMEEFRLHDLRHTHATLSLEAGIPAKVVAARLGHSNVSTTLDTYSHLTTNFQRESQKSLKDYLND